MTCSKNIYLLLNLDYQEIIYIYNNIYLYNLNIVYKKIEAKKKDLSFLSSFFFLRASRRGEIRRVGDS